MLKLIEIAQKEVEPELEKSYYNTYYCQLKNKTLENQMFTRVCAEKEGFEPPDLLQSIVFKTTAFDRSAISPVRLIRYSLNADANIESFFIY
tara:strand:- start:1302 stop:1577 length:276 start_codon:yes stop_codon:yes gene_type:complete